MKYFLYKVFGGRLSSFTFISVLTLSLFVFSIPTPLFYIALPLSILGSYVIWFYFPNKLDTLNRLERIYELAEEVNVKHPEGFSVSLCNVNGLMSNSLEEFFNDTKDLVEEIKKIRGTKYKNPYVESIIWWGNQYIDKGTFYIALEIEELFKYLMHESVDFDKNMDNKLESKFKELNARLEIVKSNIIKKNKENINNRLENINKRLDLKVKTEKYYGDSANTFDEMISEIKIFFKENDYFNNEKYKLFVEYLDNDELSSKLKRHIYYYHKLIKSSIELFGKSSVVEAMVEKDGKYTDITDKMVIFCENEINKKEEIVALENKTAANTLTEYFDRLKIEKETVR